jgi:hypothetical protein
MCTVRERRRGAEALSLESSGLPFMRQQPAGGEYCAGTRDPEVAFTATTIEVRYSAIADVGRWCLEGRLCFALPPFDCAPPKSMGQRV